MLFFIIFIISIILLILSLIVSGFILREYYRVNTEDFKALVDSFKLS